MNFSTKYPPRTIIIMFQRFTTTVGKFSSYYNKIELDCSNTFRFHDLVKHIAPSGTAPTIDIKTLAFGQQPTDHMLSIKSKDGVWDKPEIKPFQNLQLHPFNSSLHYAVQCYEGLKAYRNAKGEIRMFRSECNMMRFKHSSSKIALPDFDGKQLIKLIEEYVRIQQQWIPPHSGYSLYVRPFHFSLEDSLGVKSPHASQLLVVASPVGPYYPTGFKPISLTCSLDHIRSAPGGTGGFKVGGNYGPTIVVAKNASDKGYQQVLYLSHQKIGEVGTSNVFFVFKDPQTGKKQIVTPLLEDLVLPGVTRDTIIELLRYKGYKVSERVIMINELIERHAKGEFLECFCSGTAVIVSPVRLIEYKGKEYPIQINEQYHAGDLTYELFSQILAIQQGRAKDPFGWSRVINK